MNIPVTEENLNTPIYKATGCDNCRNIGFKGRIGIFECLSVSEEIHEQIVQKASARAIRQTAIEQGMRSLTESGWNHVKNGLTTIEEVMRYAEIETDEEVSS
jgi:type II secretory ATPase GspE/PulE/Tfp pilus assembly ATPase PilB-like protein